MKRSFLFVALAQLVQLSAGQEPRTGPQALRSGCTPYDERLGTITVDDLVEVKQALAGGEETCFRVTLTRDGHTLTGYVLGDALPAVAAFVKQQDQYRDATFEAQGLAIPATEAADAHAADHLNPDIPANFEEFGGRDMTGKPVSLSGLGGRVILVTFWSPRNAASKRQLLALLPLYNQYKRAGLRAIGISMDPNPKHIAQALDDITLGWPQVPDHTGLAKRYGANAAKGTTLVLDASHHILAVDLSPADLERKVRELLAARPPAPPAPSQ
jgi:peroxiredoxin